MQLRNLFLGAPLAAAVLLTAGCGGNRTAGTPGAGQGGKVTINGAGASFPYPIYSKWFQTYAKDHANVAFNYQAIGSGAGIAQYQAGTVDFGGTDVPLTDDEVKNMPQPTVHIPTVAGAVVLAYNIQGVEKGLKLSGQDIADIFIGTIKKWNDPRLVAANPGVALPDKDITVVHRSDGSGTTYIFTTYLSAVSPAWKQKVGTGKSVSWPVGLGGAQNAGVAGLINQSDGSIGYVELAYAQQNNLKYASVRNKAGQYVEATTASTTAAANSAAAAIAKDIRTPIVDQAGAQSYPIVGFTYLLVPETPKDEVKGRAMAEFLKWAMTGGQAMAADLGYAPLPAAVAAVNDKAIAAMAPAAAATPGT